MSTNARHLVSCAVLTLGLLVADANAQTSVSPKRGGTAVFALGSEPTSLNRNTGSNNTDGLVACMVYQGLTRVAGNGEVLPFLAESWTVSEDGLAYTFRLNKATWHDGKPFTSEDVKFSILEVSKKYSSVFAGAGKVIDTIETPAADIAVFRLREAYGPFLRSLSCTQGAGILPVHLLRGTDVLKSPVLLSAPIGTGPFMFKEWKRGDYIRLVRNPNYWEQGKPLLDEVVAKIIPNATSRTQALLTGELDYISYYQLSINDYAVIRASTKLALTPGTNPPSIDFLAINVGKRPFTDRRVRQALMFATDREFLLRVAYQGIGSIGTMPFTNRLTWAADPSVDYRKLYPFDVKRANELLDEAGLTRGADGIRFKASIVYPTDDPAGNMVATVLKSMWREAGIDVVIEPQDRVLAIKKVFADKEHDAAYLSYTSFGDPALGVARAFVTSSIGQTMGNAAGYSNPEVDKIFDQASKLT